MRRPLIVLGGLFTVLLVGYGCFALVSLLAHERTRQELSFPPGISEIQLDLAAGGVELTGATAGAISGTRTVTRGLRGPSFREVRVDEDTLRLVSDCPNFSSFNCSVNYVLTVPAGIRVTGDSSGGGIEVRKTSGLVTVSSSGGGIYATDTTGELVLDSSGGGITVERSSGRVTADSSGGGIAVLESRSDHVNANSSGGGVTLAFAEPPAIVNASSSGGGVTVVLPRIDEGYAVAADSSGGGVDVEVEVDTQSKRTIKVNSSGGGVSVSYPDTNP